MVVLRHDGRLVQGGGRARPATLLWKFKTGSGIIGQPMTYRGPDGKQYVAVYAGRRGLGGRDRRSAISIRAIRPPRSGFVNAMKDLPNYTAPGGMLYVFALP